MDASIAGLATKQHAQLHLEQLRALGLSASAVQKRAQRGRLHRIHLCVYSLVPRELMSREGHWMAAALAAGPGAVLSHRSAAALHQLREHGTVSVEVTAPRQAGRRQRGIRVHRSKTLAPEDTTTVRGIPCTTVARTLLDLAGVVNRRQLERMCDQAEILGTFDLRAVTEQLERNRRRKGARVLRAILKEHHPGQTATWSELEERFLALVRNEALPQPEVNQFIDPGDGDAAIRVDFAWRKHRVVVEADGQRTHATRQAFERDRLRDQRLTAAGWRPIRTTWRQVTHDPAALVRTLRSVLRCE